MEMNNINNKYGNGFTKYIIVDDEIITDFYTQEKKSFSIPTFLKMIDKDLFNRVTLVYYDDGGLQPHITGLVNGEKKFSIYLNKEQYQEINSNLCPSMHLKNLMDRTISGQKYDSLKEMENQSRHNQILPENPYELDEYKNYVEDCIENAKALRTTNFLELYSPVITLGCANILRFSSDFAANYNNELASLLFVGCGALTGAAMYRIVNLLLHKHYRIVEKNISKSETKLERYIEELDDINNGGLKGRKNRAINRIKRDYYDTVKTIILLVNKLPEEYHNDFYLRIRALVVKFNKKLKEAYNEEYFQEEFFKVFNECYYDFKEIIANIKELGLTEEADKTYHSLYLI